MEPVDNTPDELEVFTVDIPPITTSHNHATPSPKLTLEKEDAEKEKEDAEKEKEEVEKEKEDAEKEKEESKDEESNEGGERGEEDVEMTEIAKPKEGNQLKKSPMAHVQVRVHPYGYLHA